MISDDELIDLGFKIQPDDAAGKIAILWVPGTTVYYLPYYNRVDILWLGEVARDIKDIPSLKQVIKTHTGHEI